MAWKLVNPNITNDPSYLDPRLSDDESKISSNTTSLAQNTSQITDLTNKQGYVFIDAFPLQTGETDDTARINRMLAYANTNGKRCLLGLNKTYTIDASVSLQMLTNVDLDLNGSTLNVKPNNLTNYNAVLFYNITNAVLRNGSIVGDRNTHTTATAWQPNTAYAVNQQVNANGYILKCTTAGTSGTTSPVGTGSGITDGTVVWTWVNSGEWGMGVLIQSCTGINLVNLNISNCWGDGVAISRKATGDAHNQYIYLDRVISNNNRRQGLSVIDCDGLIVLNSEFNNSNGTAPEAGIDFEPNYDTDTINNVYFNNVKFKSSKEAQLEFNFASFTSSRDMKMTFDNIYIESPNNALAINFLGNGVTNSIYGDIVFNNPTITKFKSAPIPLNQWSSMLPTITFENPKFIVDSTFTYTLDDWSCLFKVVSADKTNASFHMPTVGNLVVKSLSCVADNTATVLPKRIMHNTLPGSVTIANEIPIDKVKIINPLHVSGLQAPTVFFGDSQGTGNYFIDGNDVCVTKMNSLGDLNKDLAPTLINDSVNPGLTTVNLQNIPIGQTVKIYGQVSGTIIKVKLIDAGLSFDVSTPTYTSNGYLTVAYGNKLTIKRISSTVFSILNNIGVTL